MADAPRRRDPGLDVIRFIAWALMVSIHFCREVPAHTSLGSLVRFLGEAAPAFFFFAFGMTLSHHFAKSPAERFARSKLFLLLGLVNDVILLLWVFQVAITLVEECFSPSRRAYAAFAGLVLAAMLAVPFPLGMAFRDLFSGFPIVPWSLFVLAGLLFSQTASVAASVCSGAALVAVGAGFHLGHEWIHWQSWVLDKWTITAPFICLFSGVSVLLVVGMRAVAGLYGRIPALPGLVEYVSRHLLLAYVLHDFPTAFIRRSVYRRFFGIELPGRLAMVRRWDFALMIGWSLACIAATIVLLWITRWVWLRVRQRRWLASLRAHYDLVALGLVFYVWLLHSAYAGFEEGVLPAGLPVGVCVGLFRLKRLVVYLVQLYLGLELTEWREHVTRAEEARRP